MMNKLLMTRTGVLVLFIIIPFSHALSQVQFRLPFDCDKVREIESERFNEFVAHRYDRQLEVYPYVEGAVSRYSTCRDSVTFLHLEFAEIYKQFLLSHYPLNRLSQLARVSRNNPKMLVVVYSEFFYQSYYVGKLGKLDSCARDVPWDQFTKEDQSLIARRLYLLMGDLLENRLANQIKGKISPKDMANFIENNIVLDRFGEFIDSLYRSDMVIEANMMCFKAFNKYRSTAQKDRLVEEVSKLQDKIVVLGFTVNEYILSSLGLKYTGFDKDFRESIILYNIRKKPGVVRVTGNNFTITSIEGVLLILSILLFVASLSYFLVVKIRYFRLKRDYTESVRAKIYGLWLKIKLIEKRN